MARILVVDDDSGVLETIEERLTFEEHAVTVASTGQTGWEYLQKNEYDIVVLDWDMPGLSGIEILKRFRAGGGTTPIIMLTGHTSIDDKELGLDSGASDYLTKPFSLKELSARIRSNLRTIATATAPPPPLGQGNEEVLKRGDLLGTRLAANYEFLEVLGTGASGIVFKARHPRLDKLVAVKTLHASQSQTHEAANARFEREARAISQIDHCNVITVHDYGITERNQPYMVMEYIKGGSLDERIDEVGALPLTTSLAILIQVCRGLQAAHAAGVLHRDLKPANILLQDKCERLDWVKIADFGIAQLLGGAHERITKAGCFVGTLMFLAPERLGDDPGDARSDIYSLGVVLFEALTARPIFDGTSVETLLTDIILHPPDPPSRYREDIPSGSALDLVVQKATEKDANKRYQTPTEMRLELERIHSELLMHRRH